MMYLVLKPSHPQNTPPSGQQALSVGDFFLPFLSFVFLIFPPCSTEFSPCLLFLIIKSIPDLVINCFPEKQDSISYMLFVNKVYFPIFNPLVSILSICSFQIDTFK